MRFAAIETSTEWCSVALSIDGETLGTEERAGTRASERVLPMLQDLLERAGLAARDLEAVAFGSGPGSFTGLRIACGVAQGLASARELPVIGISTFEAIAEESGAPRVLVCVDARMGEVYYSAMEICPSPQDRRAWREVVAASCVPPSTVVPPRDGSWLGCGSGFASYAEDLRAGFGEVLSGVRPDVYPSASAVARLALPRLQAGEGADPALAAPVYLRDKVALTKAEQPRR